MKIPRAKSPILVTVPNVPGYIAWPMVALSAFGGLYFFANRALYYPSKYPEGLWELQRSLHAQDVYLDTSDGVRLHAWWVPRPGARFVTLYFHGNAGNVTHRFRQIQEITAAGSSILVLDYRGYGKSPGWPTEKGLYIDSETAFTHLLGMGYRAEQIILHGESLGTGVAVDLASRRPCAALILEAPYSSMSDVAGSKVPILGSMLVRSFNSEQKIRWMQTPKLFIQGDHDEIIPLCLGQKLYAAAQAPKEFWVVPGAGHNDILETAGSGYRDKLEKFYGEIATDEHR